MSFDELDFLAPYMGEVRWSHARKASLMQAMDKNNGHLRLRIAIAEAVAVLGPP